jgi:hypothetical protein
MKTNYEKAATSTAELVNEVANTSSVELFNGVPQDAPTKAQLPITVKAIINGELKEIIPAFTDYNMEQPKQKATGEHGDPSKRLAVKFHFASPKLFWDEQDEKKKINLFDRNGKFIEPNTDNVYVVCDTADTYWRVFEDEILEDVEIHNFDSVEDYAQATTNTMLYSRCLNKVEEMGYAALATGNEAAKAVFEFAKKNEVPISTAKLYLDTEFKPVAVKAMMLGKRPPVTLTLGRSLDEAQALYDQIFLTFNKGGAKSRYAISAVNSLMKKSKYTFDEIIICLSKVPSSEITLAQLAKCGDKKDCIQDVLSAWLVDYSREKMKEVA